MTSLMLCVGSVMVNADYRAAEANGIRNLSLKATSQTARYTADAAKGADGNWVLQTPEEREWLADITDGLPAADRTTVKDDWMKMSHPARKALYDKIQASPPRAVDVTEDEAKWLQIMTSAASTEDREKTETLWKYLPHSKRRQAFRIYTASALPSVETTPEEKKWLTELVADMSPGNRKEFEVLWAKMPHDKRKQVYTHSTRKPLASLISGRTARGTIGKARVTMEFQPNSRVVIRGDLEGAGTWEVDDRVLLVIKTSYAVFHATFEDDSLNGIRFWDKEKNPEMTKDELSLVTPWSVRFASKP